MTSPRVLIVDNHEDNSESLALLLAADHCLVETASTGEYAIARAMGWRPDLIVLDLGLPDMPGERVVEALRAGGCSARVVAYSGFHDRERSALDSGCDAFLLKPAIDGLLRIAATIREQASG